LTIGARIAWLNGEHRISVFAHPYCNLTGIGVGEVRDDESAREVANFTSVFGLCEPNGFGGCQAAELRSAERANRLIIGVRHRPAPRSISGKIKLLKRTSVSALFAWKEWRFLAAR
jgi:hypothetical protein